MIYDSSFHRLLENHLSPVIEKEKNFICRCPWCELKEEKTHYHLYISKEIPAFNCFHCNKHGHISKLIHILDGNANLDLLLKKDKIKKIKSKDKTKYKEFKLPEIQPGQYPNKENYILSRFQHKPDIRQFKNLILDFEKFIEINNYKNFPDMKYIKSYQDHYIGFLLDNHKILSIRSIKTKFYKKIPLQFSNERDFFSFQKNSDSDIVIVGEGIFDIYSEYFFNFLNIENVNLYVAVLSKDYISGIRYSIIHHQIFMPEVIILADSNINPKVFRYLKYKTRNYVSNLKVFYNSSGSDFNEFPVNPIQLFM